MMITSILDRRISAIVNDTIRPDPVSPAQRQRLKALLQQRNNCPDEEIEAVDRQILDIVRGCDDDQPPKALGN